MNSRTVRVGVVGAGNCVSSFVQGLAHFRNVREGEEISWSYDRCRPSSRPIAGSLRRAAVRIDTINAREPFEERVAA